MGIRQYEYNQQVRAYDESVARALQQQEYKYNGAGLPVDQDNYYMNSYCLSFRAQTLF